MGLGCGTTIVKYILFVFNFLIAIGGIVLVTFGILAIVNTNDFEKVFENHSPYFASISLVVFGSVVFLISFFGCCGAIRESHCLTMTYASILLILIVAQTVIAVLIFVKRHDFKEEIMKIIQTMFNNPQDNVNMNSIDAIQSGLQCCGYQGPSSWAPNPIPSSCCGLPSGQPCTNPFTFGCNDAFRDMLEYYSAILGWVAIGVAVIQLVALVFACCLGNNIRNSERRYA